MIAQRDSAKPVTVDICSIPTREVASSAVRTVSPAMSQTPNHAILAPSVPSSRELSACLVIRCVFPAKEQPRVVSRALPASSSIQPQPSAPPVLETALPAQMDQPALFAETDSPSAVLRAEAASFPAQPATPLTSQLALPASRDSNSGTEPVFHVLKGAFHAQRDSAPSASTAIIPTQSESA